MRLHYLQHVPFEGLGAIEGWAKSKDHSITMTRLFAQEPLPMVDDFDWLIVMGGPMNIYEESRYPWLVLEKLFIEESLKKDKFVLGICLGAQLMADVLGAKIVKNTEKEIGWFPISLTEEAKEGSVFFKGIPSSFMAFHWHEDRFELPEFCTRLAESKGCFHQAFGYDDKAIGLQFHIESTRDGVMKLVRHCGGEHWQGRYVQKPDEMVFRPACFNEITKTLETFLDNCQKVILEKTPVLSNKPQK